MTSIGIVGGAGVGKSLLAKQLSAINCAPHIPEGEMGAFPPKLIDAISKRTKKIYLYKWFSNKYKKDISVANKISKFGHICFVECCLAQLEAYAQVEQENDYDKLRATYSHIKEDVEIKVLLIASKDLIRKLIKNRGRDYEQREIFVNRSINIQRKLTKILKGENKVLIISRDKYDFTNYSDIARINKRILKFAKSIKKSN